MRKITKRCVLVNVLLVGILLFTGDSEADQVSRAMLFRAAISNTMRLKSYHWEENSWVVYSGDFVADYDQQNHKVQIKLYLGFTESSNYEGVLIGSAGKWYGATSQDGPYYTGQICDDVGVYIPSGSDSETLSDPLAEFHPVEVEAIAHKLNDAAPSAEQLDGVDTRHLLIGGDDLPPTLAARYSAISFWVTTDPTPTIKQISYNYHSASTPPYSGETKTIKLGKLSQAVDIQTPPNPIVCPSPKLPNTAPIPTPVPTPTG